MIRGLGNLTHEERLKELGLFNMLKRQQGLNTVFQHLNGCYRDDGDSLQKDVQ